MSFKKLNIPLKEALERLEIESSLPFQKQILPKIKSGRDLFIIAPEGSGKTTALVISTIQKLESAAFEDAPRALILYKIKKLPWHWKKNSTNSLDIWIYESLALLMHQI